MKPETMYISNDQDLRAYLDQLELKQIREIGNWLDFPTSENMYSLSDKIVAAFTALAELHGVTMQMPGDQAMYGRKVPHGVTDLLAWRDRCEERLALHEPVLYGALGHWQLSLF